MIQMGLVVVAFRALGTQKRSTDDQRPGDSDMMRLYSMRLGLGLGFGLGSHDTDEQPSCG